MQLYTLTMQAIGPFAGRHTIDFSALGRSGLFLLEGPTGAGKSTVIDAIVFALYGQLAGGETSKQRLHSHHAGPGVEPYVDLTFEVEAGIYRVRRSPSHQRAKRRGEGTTTQNESVTLTRLHDIDTPDTGEAISTRAQEVGLEITGLIGLQREQFLQTVVLPQGEFATFLRSTGEERKKLLETIFRTDVYERMTRTLVDLRKQALRRTREATDTVRIATEGLATAADVDSTSLLDAGGRLDPERCDILVARAETVERDAQKAAAEAKDALGEAQRALRRAEALAASLDTRTQLLRRREALIARTGEVEAAVDAIDAALKATAIRSIIAAAARASQTLREAESAHDRASVGLGGDRVLTLDQCRERDTALTERLTRLSDVIALESGLAERQRELEGLRTDLVAAREQLAAVESRVEARPARRAAIAQQLAEHVDVADGLAAAESAREAAAATVSAARMYASLLAQQSVATTRLAEAVTVARAAVDHQALLRRRRIAGMAGELATALVDGQQCAVCGSTEHPQPAVRAADHPHQDQIDDADRRVEEAERALTTARSVVDRREAEVVAAHEAAGGASIDEATVALADAVHAVDVSRAAAARCDELRADLESLEAQTSADLEHRRRLDELVLTSQERQKALAADLDRDRATVAAALQDEDDSLAALASRLEAERASVRRYEGALRALADARRARERAEAAVATALAEQEFDDEATAIAAALLPDEVNRLDRLVDEHRQETAIVEDGLARPEIAILTGTEDPALAATREAHERADREHTERAGVAAAARQRHRQVLAKRDDLDQAVAAHAAAVGDAETVIRVADVVEGSSPANLKKLTLGTYVLMRRFEDVVVAANSRLAPMSGGRYQLRATDEKERSGRSSKTGLSLAVIDAETGQEREPRTLSGGETFYVSLCLALGLADVVTAEAGGVQLGTLFVDEGFGTLDPATLDDVMAELTGLARGGRTVGIVSHVEELKQRVSDRIEIRRRDDGSSSLTVLV